LGVNAGVNRFTVLRWVKRTILFYDSKLSMWLVHVKGESEGVLRAIKLCSRYNHFTFTSQTTVIHSVNTCLEILNEDALHTL